LCALFHALGARIGGFLASLFHRAAGLLRRVLRVVAGFIDILLGYPAWPSSRYLAGWWPEPDTRSAQPIRLESR
jgi:hypothetical protein